MLCLLLVCKSRCSTLDACSFISSKQGVIQQLREVLPPEAGRLKKKISNALEGNLLKCCLSTENHWNKLPINFISVLNFNGKFGPNDMGNAWVFGVEHCNCQYGKTQCKLLGFWAGKSCFLLQMMFIFRDSCCLTHAWPNFAICARLSNPFAIQIFSWAWPRARSKNAIHACICEPNCPRRASEIYFRNSFTYPP